MANHCRAKAASGWPSVLGWLGLIWCLLLPAIALAQTETANHSSADKKSSTSQSALRSKSTTASTTASSSVIGESGRSVTPFNCTLFGVTLSSARRKKSHSVASSHGNKGKRSRSKRALARGQQKIDPQRAEEIQEALIREHYMTGEPTGKWDQSSEDALRRYQADHGWQSKTVPDSRALISLGLGPHDHLLNPESAMTTGRRFRIRQQRNHRLRAPDWHSAGPAPASTSPTPATGSQPNSAQHDPSSQQK